MLQCIYIELLCIVSAIILQSNKVLRDSGRAICQNKVENFQKNFEKYLTLQ